MAYSRECSTYWCDKCGRECVIDWHNSGDVYFVLKCTKCPWTRVYIAQSDVVDRRERKDRYEQEKCKQAAAAVQEVGALAACHPEAAGAGPQPDQNGRGCYPVEGDD